MLLSDSTIAILKNFSTIHTGIYFREGNILRTMNQGKTVLAEATIDEHIPAGFGIYELSQFLAILSLHKASPEITVKGSNLLIEGGRSTITYRCCAEEIIKGAPTKGLVVPSNDITFTLGEDDFHWVMRTASILKSPNIAVVGDRGKVFIKTYDSDNDSEAFDSLEVSTYTGEPFLFVFKTENWKMMNGTYSITISSQGIASFTNEAKKLTYWIALESKK